MERGPRVYANPMAFSPSQSAVNRLHHTITPSTASLPFNSHFISFPPLPFGMSLAQHLNLFIRNLNEERGLLDRYFQMLEIILDQGNNPMFISETCRTHSKESEENIEELACYMVVRACEELGRACDDNKDRCVECFEELKEDYCCTLHENLSCICAIDKARIANETRRRDDEP